MSTLTGPLVSLILTEAHITPGNHNRTLASLSFSLFFSIFSPIRRVIPLNPTPQDLNLKHPLLLYP